MNYLELYKQRMEASAMINNIEEKLNNHEQRISALESKVSESEIRYLNLVTTCLLFFVFLFTAFPLTLYTHSFKKVKRGGIYEENNEKTSYF